MVRSMWAAAPSRGRRRPEHDDRDKDIEPRCVAPDYPDRTVIRAGRGPPPSGEEPVDRCHDQHRQGREAEAAQVRRLQHLQGRGMPPQGDQVRGGRDHEQEREPRREGEVNPLPDGRPDPLRAPGPGVLGDERGDVTGGHLRQRVGEPVPHHRRERRGHLPRVVPREQQGVHEHLDGHEALADDQREGEREQLPIPPGSRRAGGRGLGKIFGASAGLFGGSLRDPASTHQANLIG